MRKGKPKDESHAWSVRANRMIDLVFLEMIALAAIIYFKGSC